MNVSVPKCIKPLQPDDNYEEAILRLQNTAIMLFGGYYEPKSDRDVELAQEIGELLEKRQRLPW